MVHVKILSARVCLSMYHNFFREVKMYLIIDYKFFN